MAFVVVFALSINAFSKTFYKLDQIELKNLNILLDSLHPSEIEKYRLSDSNEKIPTYYNFINLNSTTNQNQDTIIDISLSKIRLLGIGDSGHVDSLYFPNLQSLQILYCNISANLEKFNLPKLVELNLAGNKIDKFPNNNFLNLNRLNLSRNPIKNYDFSKFTQLKYLNLSETEVDIFDAQKIPSSFPDSMLFVGAKIQKIQNVNDELLSNNQNKLLDLSSNFLYFTDLENFINFKGTLYYYNQNYFLDPVFFKKNGVDYAGISNPSKKSVILWDSYEDSFLAREDTILLYNTMIAVFATVTHPNFPYLKFESKAFSYQDTSLNFTFKINDKDLSILNKLKNKVELSNLLNQVGWKEDFSQIFSKKPSIFGISFYPVLKSKNQSNVLIDLQVSALILNDLSLYGEIDSLDFEELKILYMPNNFLNGKLPVLGDKLVTIDLSNNKFSGQLDYLNQKNLLTLNLSRNKLEGNFPKTISNRIQQIDISFNKIATIADSLNYPELLELNLTNNNIQGALPFNNCPKLMKLILDSNYFDSNLNQSIISPNLQVLNLQKNNFSSSLPILASTSLNKLLLGYNQFDSGLETYYTNSNQSQKSNLPFLTTLGLEFNKFKDTLKEFDNLQRLQNLYIFNNKFTEIDKKFNKIYNQLYIEDNKLTYEDLEKFSNQAYLRAKTQDTILPLSIYNSAGKTFVKTIANGFANKIEWYRNDEAVQYDGNESLECESDGYYFGIVTNSIIKQTRIFTDTIYVSTNSISENENKVYQINYSNGNIKLANLGNEKLNVFIFDLLGKELAAFDLETESIYEFRPETQSKIIFVRIQNKNKQYLEKVLMK